MEIRSENGKILVNPIVPRPSTNISINGQVQKEVDKFRYLGAAQTKHETSLKAVKIGLVRTYSAMTRLIY